MGNEIIVINKNIKYRVLDDYLYSSLSNSDIANKYNIPKDRVNDIIKKLYKDFQVMQESKALVGTYSSPYRWKELYDKTLDSDKINEDFLKELSDPTDTLLSDREILFCELYNADNDLNKAIEESKLNIGLDRTNTKGVYNRALEIRGFYLLRKPNVISYLQRIQKEKLELITEGKAFVQTELLTIMQLLKSRKDDRSLQTYLKALEQLGKTLDAYSTTIKIEDTTGDSALDKILAKAQQAQVVDSELIDLQ